MGVSSKSPWDQWGGRGDLGRAIAQAQGSEVGGERRGGERTHGPIGAWDVGRQVGRERRLGEGHRLGAPNGAPNGAPDGAPNGCNSGHLQA